jgi:hypothetical protein
MSIDTLDYAKRLEAAGGARSQAEAHAEALSHAISDDYVTKSYLVFERREICPRPYSLRLCRRPALFPELLPEWK